MENYPLTSFMGLNTEVSEFKLKDWEATDLSNVDVDYRGYLRNRNGYSAVNANQISGAPNVLGVFGFYKDGVASYKKLCAAGTKLYQFDGTDFVDLKTGLTTGGRWNFIAHNNICYAVDDKNTPQKITESGGTYTAADWTAVTNNPPDLAPFIIVHRDRIFIAGDPDNASLVVYSTTAVTPDFDATGITGVPVLKGDGQKITGISKLGFNLIAFKKHQIHHISGCSSADFTRRIIIPGKGSYANRSIVNTGNTLTFLHESGILNFNGTSIQDLSTGFTTKIRGIDDDYIQNACAIYYNKRYWLSYTSEGETSNDKTLVIDSISGACTEYDYGINSFYLDYDNNLYGAADSGWVYLLDSGTYDVAADITSYWQSRYMDFDMPGVTKDLKEIVVYVSLSSESMTFTLYVDQNRQNWTKTITPVSSTVKEVRFSVNREIKGKRFRVKIAHTGHEAYRVEQIIFRFDAIAREGVRADL